MNRWGTICQLDVTEWVVKDLRTQTQREGQLVGRMAVRHVVDCTGYKKDGKKDCMGGLDLVLMVKAGLGRCSSRE